MNRRQILGTGVGFGVAYGGLVYGLSKLQGQDSKLKEGVDSKPAYIKAAQKRMAATGRGAVVFVIPDDEAMRKKAGLSLAGLIQHHPLVFGSDPEDAKIRMSDADAMRNRNAEWRAASLNFEAAACVICVSREDAARYFEAPPSQDMILLDPLGRVIARKDLKPGETPTPKRLLAFVLGEREAHLTRIVRTARQLLNEKERQQVEELLVAARGVDRLPESEKRRRLAPLKRGLAGIANRISACLLLGCGSDARLFRVLSDVLYAGSEKRLESRLPYGTKLPKREKIDPCPACGMAVMKPRGLEFVSRLQRKRNK